MEKIKTIELEQEVIYLKKQFQFIECEKKLGELDITFLNNENSEKIDEEIKIIENDIKQLEVTKQLNLNKSQIIELQGLDQKKERIVIAKKNKLYEEIKIIKEKLKHLENVKQLKIIKLEEIYLQRLLTKKELSDAIEEKNKLNIQIKTSKEKLEQLQWFVPQPSTSKAQLSILPPKQELIINNVITTDFETIETVIEEKESVLNKVTNKKLQLKNKKQTICL